MNPTPSRSLRQFYDSVGLNKLLCASLLSGGGGGRGRRMARGGWGRVNGWRTSSLLVVSDNKLHGTSSILRKEREGGGGGTGGGEVEIGREKERESERERERERDRQTDR